MSGKELTEWQAFEAIDGPIGNQRADLRAGIVAATIAKCHLSLKHILRFRRKEQLEMWGVPYTKKKKRNTKKAA